MAGVSFKPMADRTPTIPPANDDFIRAFDTLDYLYGMVEAQGLIAATPHTAQARLPVIIVSGFLGAGKTTLMRRLLTGDHGLRITAIVNDFAALNIDAALLREVTDDTMALANGCMCCSLAGRAAQTLMSVRALDPMPDLVVIEASGIADPFALSQVALSVPGIVVDAVIAVADATMAERWTEDYLMKRQITTADLVLLNKTDLVPAQDAACAETAIMRLAPGAQVLRTVACAVPARVVLDVSCNPMGSVGISTRAAGATDSALHMDDERFLTITLSADEPVARDAFEAVLSGLGDGVLRAKGFLHLRDRPDAPELLQLVGRRWRWEPAPKNTGDASRLVVIGLARQMDPAAFSARFSGIGFKPI